MVTTRPRITKSIQLRVDIDIHKRLKDIKGDRTWEDFLIEAGLQYGKAEEAKE